MSAAVLRRAMHWRDRLAAVAPPLAHDAAAAPVATLDAEQAPPVAASSGCYDSCDAGSAAACVVGSAAQSAPDNGTSTSGAGSEDHGAATATEAPDALPDFVLSVLSRGKRTQPLCRDATPLHSAAGERTFARADPAPSTADAAAADQHAGQQPALAPLPAAEWQSAGDATPSGRSPDDAVPEPGLVSKPADASATAPESSAAAQRWSWWPPPDDGSNDVSGAGARADEDEAAAASAEPTRAHVDGAAASTPPSDPSESEPSAISTAARSAPPSAQPWTIRAAAEVLAATVARLTALQPASDASATAPPAPAPAPTLTELTFIDDVQAGWRPGPSAQLCSTVYVLEVESGGAGDAGHASAFYVGESDDFPARFLRQRKRFAKGTGGGVSALTRAAFVKLDGSAGKSMARKIESATIQELARLVRGRSPAKTLPGAGWWRVS